MHWVRVTKNTNVSLPGGFVREAVSVSMHCGRGVFVQWLIEAVG